MIGPILLVVGLLVGCFAGYAMAEEKHKQELQAVRDEKNGVIDRGETFVVVDPFTITNQQVGESRAASDRKMKKRALEVFEKSKETADHFKSNQIKDRNFATLCRWIDHGNKN